MRKSMKKTTMHTLKSCMLAFLLGLLAIPSSAQVLQEGFDGAVFPPAGWAVFDNGVGTNISWAQATGSFQGAGCAYIDYDCSVSTTSEDWLVTPQVAIPAAGAVLSFYHRQPDTYDYGSLYIIKVSTTSQTNPATFVGVDTILEPQVPLSYGIYTLDLSAFAGQSIFIAFAHEQNCGDDWFIDELVIGGNCVPPTNFNFVSSTTTTADFTFTPSSGPAQMGIVPSGAPVMATSGPLAGGSYQATGLAAGTLYDAYVRTLCPSDPPLMISGVWDGPLPGGQPKGTELYVLDSIPDLSRYGISSANNGTGTTAPNPEFAFPAVSVAGGTYLYVTSDSAAFSNYYGFNADFVTNAMLINGDDAVELFQDSVVVDVFGDVNMDGTGTAWDFLDGWAYRMSGASPNGGVFVDSLWTYSGINATDGCTTNGSCASVFPIGTFVGSSNTASAWAGPITFSTQCLPFIGDSASNPIPVTAISFQDSGNTSVCFTDQGGNVSADAWYQVVIDPCADSLYVSLCGSGYDTFLALLDATGSVIVTNDDSGPFCPGLQSSAAIPVTGGDTVFVVVEGFDVEEGAYVLDITQIVSVPAVSVTYGTSSYCANDTINPTPTVTGPGGGFYFGSPGLALDSISGEVDLSQTTPGTYVVTYITLGACSASDTALVTVNPAEDPFFAYASDSLCLGDPNVSPSSVATPGGSFSGSASGLVINASTGEIDLTASTAGSYTVTYNTGGPCSEVSTEVVVIVDCSIGILDALAGQFDVFPNPNAGSFHITNQGADMDAAIEVVDMVGKVVYKAPATLSQGLRHNVDMPNVTAGTYFLRISGEAGTAMYKLMIQHN